MTYGCDHGWIMWAPGWVKGAVCTLWNWINCALHGHELIGVDAFKNHVWPGAPRCSYCSAALMVDGKYPTPEEVEENDRLCYAEWDAAKATQADACTGFNQEPPPTNPQ